MATLVLWWLKTKVATRLPAQLQKLLPQDVDLGAQAEASATHDNCRPRVGASDVKEDLIGKIQQREFRRAQLLSSLLSWSG